MDGGPGGGEGGTSGLLLGVGGIDGALLASHFGMSTSLRPIMTERRKMACVPVAWNSGTGHSTALARGLLFAPFLGAGLRAGAPPAWAMSLAWAP